MIRIPAGTHILNRQVRHSHGQSQHVGLNRKKPARCASQAVWCRPSFAVHPLLQIIIKRPRLILRGDGSATTVFKVDNPLKDIPNVPQPKGGYGFYNQGAC